MKNKYLLGVITIAVILSSFMFSPLCLSFAISNSTDAQALVSRINLLRSEILQTNNLSKTNSEETLIQKARERKELMKKLMKDDPVLFNTIAIKDSERAQILPALQNEIEYISPISGEITVTYVDDFSNQGNSHIEYYLESQGIKYSLYPTSEISYASSTKITATGYIIDNQISINTSKNPIIKTGEPAPLGSVGNQRTLVLLVKSFSGDPEPFTITKAHDLVFNSQFQNFMKEQSYNKVSFSGDVFGWTSINQQIPSGYFFLSNEQLVNVINTYNINLANYDRIIYLLAPNNINPNIGNGMSTIGKSIIVINNNNYFMSQASVGLTNYDYNYYLKLFPFSWTNLDNALSHELGHSLGVGHANNWLCTNGQILYGNCVHNEYGNFFDVMGGQMYSLDYNAYFKEQLGWMPSEQILPIIQSGTYTIHPLEFEKGVKLAKVYIKGTTENSYSIELRKPIGFDLSLKQPNPNLIKNTNGIFINKIKEGPSTELLDMSPNPKNSLENVTLNLPIPGPNPSGGSVYSFSDPGRGITIGPVLSVSDSSISFNVNITKPTCTRFVPTIVNFGVSYTELNAGSWEFGSNETKNNDYYGCGQSTFTNTLIFPSTWQIANQSVNLPIKPENSEWSYWTFQVPKNVTPGLYTLSLISKNNSSGQTATKYLTINVTEPVKTPSINKILNTIPASSTPSVQKESEPLKIITESAQTATAINSSNDVNLDEKTKNTQLPNCSKFTSRVKSIFQIFKVNVFKNC